MHDKPITVICGHYGCGKTNLALNLAVEAAATGRRSVIVDMDIVNPYFRSSEYRTFLERHGVQLIAPVFANTTLDTPVLPPEIYSIFNMENTDMFIDAGGDDVGATALGRSSANRGCRLRDALRRKPVPYPFDKAGRNAAAPSRNRNGVAPKSDGDRQQLHLAWRRRYANGA